MPVGTQCIVAAILEVVGSGRLLRPFPIPSALLVPTLWVGLLPREQQPATSLWNLLLGGPALAVSVSL